MHALRQACRLRDRHAYRGSLRQESDRASVAARRASPAAANLAPGSPDSQHKIVGPIHPPRFRAQADHVEPDPRVVSRSESTRCSTKPGTGSTRPSTMDPIGPVRRADARRSFRRASSTCLRRCR